MSELLCSSCCDHWLRISLSRTVWLLTCITRHPAWSLPVHSLRWPLLYHSETGHLLPCCVAGAKCQSCHYQSAATAGLYQPLMNSVHLLCAMLYDHLLMASRYDFCCDHSGVVSGIPCSMADCKCRSCHHHPAVLLSYQPIDTVSSEWCVPCCMVTSCPILRRLLLRVGAVVTRQHGKCCHSCRVMLLCFLYIQRGDNVQASFGV